MHFKYSCTDIEYWAFKQVLAGTLHVVCSVSTLKFQYCEDHCILILIRLRQTWHHWCLPSCQVKSPHQCGKKCSISAYITLNTFYWRGLILSLSCGLLDFNNSFESKIWLSHFGSNCYELGISLAFYLGLGLVNIYFQCFYPPKIYI